jgi:hypothetical protein
VGAEVLGALKMSVLMMMMKMMIIIIIIWVLAPCRFVGRCHRFGETYYLHLLG